MRAVICLTDQVLAGFVPEIVHTSEGLLQFATGFAVDVALPDVLAVNDGDDSVGRRAGL